MRRQCNFATFSRGVIPSTVHQIVSGQVFSSQVLSCAEERWGGEEKLSGETIACRLRAAQRHASKSWDVVSDACIIPAEGPTRKLEYSYPGAAQYIFPVSLPINTTLPSSAAS